MPQHYVLKTILKYWCGFYHSDSIFLGVLQIAHVKATIGVLAVNGDAVLQMQLKMSFTIEKVLADARTLVNRLKDHDGAADNLIAVSQTMYRRVDSMRQYQEDLNELNEIARHRPRANLIMGLVQENTQIRELQQENKELRACLEEHQSAIELIMSKYREQMVKLLMANKMDGSSKENSGQAQVVGEKMDKICEMAAVMQKAIRAGESEFIREKERMAQLETENKTLRELLMIGCSNSGEVSKMDKSTQAEIAVSEPCFNSSGNLDTESLPTTDDEDHHFVNNEMNTSVIENKSFKLENFFQQAPLSRSSRSGDSVSSTDSSSLNESAERISVKDLSLTIKSTPQQQTTTAATEQKSEQQSHQNSEPKSSDSQENCIQDSTSNSSNDADKDLGLTNNGVADDTIKNTIPTTPNNTDVKTKGMISKDVNANTGTKRSSSKSPTVQMTNSVIDKTVVASNGSDKLVLATGPDKENNVESDC